MEEYLERVGVMRTDVAELASSLILKTPVVPTKRVYKRQQQQAGGGGSSSVLELAGSPTSPPNGGDVDMTDPDEAMQQHSRACSLADKIVGNIPASVLVDLSRLIAEHNSKAKGKITAITDKKALNAALLVEERVLLAAAVVKWNLVPWIAVANSDRMTVETGEEHCQGQHCQFVIYPGFAGPHRNDTPATAVFSTHGGHKIPVCNDHRKTMLSWHGLACSLKLFPDASEADMQKRRASFVMRLRGDLLPCLEEGWKLEPDRHRDLEDMLSSAEMERGQPVGALWTSVLAPLVSKHVAAMRRKQNAQNKKASGGGSAEEPVSGRKRKAPESTKKTNGNKRRRTADDVDADAVDASSVEQEDPIEDIDME